MVVDGVDAKWLCAAHLVDGCFQLVKSLGCCECSGVEAAESVFEMGHEVEPVDGEFDGAVGNSPGNVVGEAFEGHVDGFCGMFRSPRLSS